ncbi:M20 family metallopeptidase [Metaclostridioides mangenotii]|uniref:Glutamate carboxypeptidase n=1 Tax=Metaclostridioides mangenotii TaxID=1540 RepID=A0ABS4E7Z3_9FIRM|nr:M20 family metallopeptidase [Clostridioides mangenotii]MBP1854070.1 glutamate carboxypeptidase [Clostridioides mangenotii]
MNKHLKEINEFIDSRREEILDLWREIVNLESYTGDKQSVNVVANRLKLELEKDGFDVELIDVGKKNGDTLVATLGSDRGNEPVIFSGHMDTVFENGTFGENPFRIEDGKAYGPGVLDMKGGIVIALYVIKALNHIGYKERPLKVIISGDEEQIHEGSTGAEVLSDAAKGGYCSFNMETGLVDNCLCIGRKGRIGCEVTVEGVETHAGNDFTGGRNAIEEMAHKILELQKLTNLEEGRTVSVSVIKGGRIPNAIPKDCKIEIDIRFAKVGDMESIKQKINDISAKIYVEGTTTKVNYIAEMMAFETNENVIKFYDFVSQVCEENNFGKFGSRPLGGSSDASYLTIAKVPTLCSFGVRGEWNHTEREYAIVESVFERAKVLSTIVLNLDKFKY